MIMLYKCATKLYFYEKGNFNKMWNAPHVGSSNNICGSITIYPYHIPYVNIVSCKLNQPTASNIENANYR